MKRFFILALMVLTVVAFSSCKKDGVYKPGRKISKIFKSDSYTYESYYEWEGTWHTSEGGTDKYLREKWDWDGNLLEKITYYDPDGEEDEVVEFSYDGKRLEEIEEHNTRITFEYDGRNLETIEIYYKGEREAYINVDHDGRKISELEFHYVGDNWKKGDGPDFNKMLELSMFMFLPTPDDSKRICEARKSSAKDEETWTVKLDWDGDNIEKMTEIEGTHRDVTKYSYDDKKNPYRGFLYYLADEGDVKFGSKNNVTKEVHTCSESNEGPSTTEYKYKYDGKWPERRTETESYSGDNYRSTYTYVTYYDYDD